MPRPARTRRMIATKMLRILCCLLRRRARRCKRSCCRCPGRLLEGLGGGGVFCSFIVCDTKISSPLPFCYKNSVEVTIILRFWQEGRDHALSYILSTFFGTVLKLELYKVMGSALSNPSMQTEKSKKLFLLD